MKLIHYFLFLLLASCTNKKKNPETISTAKQKVKYQSVLISADIEDSAKQKITNFPNIYSSDFKTKIFSQFYVNDTLAEAITEDSISIDSWYSINSDTIDMVMHPDNWFGPSSSPLIRITKDSIKVFLLAAAHDPLNLKFKLNITDTFSSYIEVPAKKYTLKLSAKPDIKTKLPVYGYIDMESEDYYEKVAENDKTDTKAPDITKNRVLRKFYFRSQNRHYDY